MELDQKIEDLVQPISDFFTDIIFVSISFQNNSLPLVVIWLVFASLFFTFYFRFINIRAFKRAFFFGGVLLSNLLKFILFNRMFFKSLEIFLWPLYIWLLSKYLIISKIKFLIVSI